MTRASVDRLPRVSFVGLGVLTVSTFIASTTDLLPMSETMDVDESTMGLLVTVYALAVVLLALPITFATSRMPSKPLLVATRAGYAASNVVVTVEPSFAVLCLG